MGAALLLPTGAPAQVVVDPDSPAGKEYAIPLQQKQSDATGGKDGGKSHPFGEGISKPGSKQGDAAESGDSSRKKSGKDRDKDDFDTTGALSGSDSSGGGGGSSAGPDEAGTNGALLTSGIALAVLLLGGGIAFLMRRGAFGTDA